MYSFLAFYIEKRFHGIHDLFSLKKGYSSNNAEFPYYTGFPGCYVKKINK